LRHHNSLLDGQVHMPSAHIPHPPPQVPAQEPHRPHRPGLFELDGLATLSLAEGLMEEGIVPQSCAGERFKIGQVQCGAMPREAAGRVWVWAARGLSPSNDT